MSGSFPLKIVISAIDRYSTTFANLSNKFNRIGQSADRMGKSLSAKVSLPLGIAGLTALKTTADFERMNQSLVTAFQGNEKAAADAQNSIVKFAAKTPYELQEVLEAFIKLKNLGLDPSEAALTSYGNTAGSMGKSLNQMVEAVADATTGEFERLKEFGIKAQTHGNKIAFTFRGTKTVVRKNAADIQKYLLSLGNTAFAGGMERQAKTLGGVFSNFKDAMTLSFNALGVSIVQTTKLKDRLVSLTDTIARLTDKFKKLSPDTQEFIVFTGLIAVAVGPALIALGQLAFGLSIAISGFVKIGGAIKAIVLFAPKLVPIFGFIISGLLRMSALMFATPFGLIIGGIMLIAGAAYIIYKKWDWLKEKWGKMWDWFGEKVKSVASFITPIIETITHPIDALMKSMNFIGEKAASIYNRVNGNDNTGGRVIGAKQVLAKASGVAGQSKTSVDVVFKNPPQGMRTSIKTDDKSNVNVSQGLMMATP